MNEPKNYPTPEGERIITTAPMSLERAREILKKAPFHFARGDCGWEAPHAPEMFEGELDEASLHGRFTADQLEALAVWMRAHAK